MKLALALVATAALALTAMNVSRAGDGSCTDPSVVARTRARILQVEESMRAAPVAGLTPEQRTARTQALGELHRYALLGVFPHNHESLEYRPIFVDEHGTICAFANLLVFSGRRELVERIAATRNHAKVAELANEPEVVSWSRETGISVDEASRIQEPGYNFSPLRRGRGTTSAPNEATMEVVPESSTPVQASIGGLLVAFAAAGGVVWRRRRAARTLPAP